MTRIYNANVLAPDASSFFFGEIHVDDEGRILGAYPAPDAPEIEADEEIDADFAFVLPGFKNAHTHSAMTFLRSRADDESLSDWLHKTVFPREALLTDEDVYWLTRLAILEYLRGGTTAVFDMYFHTDAFARACRDSGFRAVLCGSATAFEKDPIACVRALYEDNNREGDLLSAVLGFHAEYTASEELLKELSSLAHEKRAPVFMHVSETQDEVKECVARHGVTPAVYFDSLGLFDFGGGGFHCVHFSEEDMELFRQKGLFVVSCPASNLKLASGVAPLSDYLAKGIPVALGTDGPASNNALDFFREMYLATTLQKMKTNNAAAFPAEEVLKSATGVGARAMGLFDCDCIAPGKWADLVFVSADAPNLNPRADAIKSLVYSAGVQNVTRTMIAGRTLYHEGEYFVGEDVRTIYENCQEITERIENEIAQKA
ncbi:MAG: amidohydrolase [Clostridia bacterium]|nr:amidohydrolase [Clostridia bacterium]